MAYLQPEKSFKGSYIYMARPVISMQFDSQIIPFILDAMKNSQKNQLYACEYIGNNT